MRVPSRCRRTAAYRAHGDLFDPIEDLPDPWARWAVQFLPGKDASTKPLGHAIEIQSPAGVPARHGVSNNHPLIDRATRFRSGVNDGDSNKLKKLGLPSKLPVRLFVIGHTHHPRIVQHATFFIGHIPVPGVNIMDCGGWIEKSQLLDGVVPSCHVGIIAETAAGADARIYQLRRLGEPTFMSGRPRAAAFLAPLSQAARRASAGPGPTRCVTPVSAGLHTGSLVELPC
jgi:hypothetical protein